MPTYREHLLQTSAIAQDFTFDQALRWMDAFETYQLGKAELRPKKKRASRLRQQLDELQQPPPARLANSPWADCQPLLCNPAIEAALPNEAPTATRGPLFTSDAPGSCELEQIAASTYHGWQQYRLGNASTVSEVFFSPHSPRKTSHRICPGRAEYATQAIQLTELFTHMLCSDDPQQRAAASTFQRSPFQVDYDEHPLSNLPTSAFVPDATYTRDGNTIGVYLPCAYWWDGQDALRQFLTQLIEHCESQGTAYELWQPGLIADLRC